MTPQQPEKPPLDVAARALAWVVLGVFVAECLTGLVLALYFRSGAGARHADAQYLQFDVPFGMVMRNLHRLFALALLFVAPFALVRAALWNRQPGGRPARIAAGVALVALALPLLVPRTFAPWETVFTHVADWLPADQAPPPPPVHGPHSARDLLPTELTSRSAFRRRLSLYHAIAAPLSLLCLLAVGAHRLRRRL